MDPKQPLEIDHGDDAIKRGWEGEIARQARQAKIVREMEWDAAVRRARIIRWTVKVPMAAIVLACATLLGLDYAGRIDLGIFPRHIVEAQPLPSVLAKAEEGIAARNIPNAEPESVPVVAAPVTCPVAAVVAAPTPAQAPEPAPEVARPVADPEQVAKLQRKIQRAHAGVVALTKTIDERSGLIANANVLLWGVPIPGGRDHSGLDWQIRDLSAAEAQFEQSCGGNPTIQQANAMADTNTTINNLIAQQGNVQRQIAHDQEVLASTQTRLAKATAEEAAAAALLKTLQP